jgi:hypothetical protein
MTLRDRLPRIFHPFVVAILAGRFHVEFLIDVALPAIEFDVEVTEPNPRHLVLESAGIPVHVARSAFGVEFRNLTTCRVAGAAIEILVKPVVRPSDLFVCEERLDLGIVAMAALGAFVTSVTGLVVLLEGLLRGFDFAQLVTVAAALLFVTIDALEVEKLDVLLVVKRDDGSLCVGGLVNFGLGLMHDRVGDADDIGLVAYRRREGTPRLLYVAYRALRLVTPFAVTSHALAVVRALQSRLPKVPFSRPRLMAFLAGRM